MLALRLPKDVEKRLEDLAKKTKRSKSFLAREAILAQLEDIEDYHLGLSVLNNPGRIYSSEEVRKICGLDD